MDKVTKELTKQITSLEDQFGSVNRKLISELTKILSKNMSITNGRVLIDENLDIIAGLDNMLEEAFQKSGYYSVLTDSVLQSKENAQLVFDFASGNIANLGMIDNKTINGLIQMQWDGIKTVPVQIKENLKNGIYQSILSGRPFSSIVDSIQKQSDQLVNRTLTQVRTFKREFAQTIENETAKQIGFGENKDDIWEYLGAPLQDNSHPECVLAVEKQYFTNQEKEDFENGVGEIPHSEPRWNCQHRFVMTNLTYKEAFGESKAEVPEFKTKKEIESYLKENYTKGKEYIEPNRFRFSGRAESNIGKFDLKKLNIEQSIRLQRLIDESNSVADELNIPRIRGVKGATGGRGAAADMGDGIVGFNNRSFLRINNEQKVSKESLGEYFKKVKDQIGYSRPTVASDYFITDSMKVAETRFWHEFGHHIHQQRYRDTFIGGRNYTSYEIKIRKLYSELKKKGLSVDRGSWKKLMPTSYCQNAEEWFAECYSMHKMGLDNLLAKDILDFFKEEGL